jgi:hypothetical protein
MRAPFLFPHNRATTLDQFRRDHRAGGASLRCLAPSFPAACGAVCRKRAAAPSSSPRRRAPIPSARGKARALPVEPRAGATSPAFSRRVV